MTDTRTNRPTLADYCPGHESLRGDAMGASVYCDGTCLTGDELADALAELAETDDRRSTGAATIIDATVTATRVESEDGDTFWRVVVTVPAMPGPGRETTVRDYARFSADNPDGMLAHEAALDLLGLVLTS